MKYVTLFTCLSFLFLIFSSFETYAQDIEIPKGIYSSHIGRDVDKYIDEPYVSGALVRVRWSEIEPQEGQYDFSAIEKQRMPVIEAKKNWSLAVIAGSNEPNWLEKKTDKRIHIKFRREDKSIIPFWNTTYQKHAQKLAQALAKRYRNDPRLVLVYVPQQTANGIEGHFNGSDFHALADQGLNNKNWLYAIDRAITSYTKAFPNKAIAIELHEIFNETEIPEKIISYIEQNHANQVGIGMWWLSGKQTYQHNLLTLLEQTNLPIYAQVIGRSSQKRRFLDEQYSTVFAQAKKLGIGYIEVWNYELEKQVEPHGTQSIKEFSNYSKNK